MTTGPLSPPFRIVVGVSSTNSPFASVALWQARQLRLKIGNTCVSKSTFLASAGMGAGVDGAGFVGAADSAAKSRPGVRPQRRIGQTDEEVIERSKVFGGKEGANAGRRAVPGWI